MKNEIEFSAAIFDLDGTLLDSNPVWEKLDRVILEKRGIKCSAELARSLAAMTYEEAAEALREMGISLSTEELKKEINELAEYEYANNISLKEGAEEYLNYLNRSKVKIALATASPENFYAPALRRLGVYELFCAFVTVDDVGKSKEFPDIYLRAAELAETAPENCAVFEDVLTGLRTAASAGMKTVGVYDKYSEKDMENIKKVTNKYVYSFNEML